MASWWLVGAGIVAVILTGVLLGLWWWVPKFQIRSITVSDPKDRADIEDNFRKTIGQALGGIAVLFGAVAAYLQFSQQQQSAHDLLISNQVAKGFEQLGSDKLVVRLGGIYALEGVMNASQRYHRAVLDALCAFVRDATSTMPITRPPTTDVQAVLTVLARRSIYNRIYLDSVDLNHANLPKAELAGAKLSYADLSAADLSGANLFAASLNGARLVNTDLSHADLRGVALSYANLSGANLSGADLDQALLDHADLRGAINLSQAQIASACGIATKVPPSLHWVDHPCSGIVYLR